MNDESMKKTWQTVKRREFLKQAAYAAPVILTLKAEPSFAGSGSDPGDQGEDNDDQGQNMG